MSVSNSLFFTKRLKNAGSEPFEELLRRQGEREGLEATAQGLAPFAPKIVALDEMTGGLTDQEAPKEVEGSIY